MTGCMISCKNCGKSFRLPHPKTKYCSDVCRKKKKNSDKQRLLADPSYRERQKKYARERMRVRMADPDYRERVRKRERELYTMRVADPDYLARYYEKKREQARIRMADPEYRERFNERSLKTLHRRMADPNYRAKRAEIVRARKAKERAILAYVKELGIISIGDLK